MKFIADFSIFNPFNPLTIVFLQPCLNQSFRSCATRFFSGIFIFIFISNPSLSIRVTLASRNTSYCSDKVWLTRGDMRLTRKGKWPVYSQTVLVPLRSSLWLLLEKLFPSEDWSNLTFLSRSSPIVFPCCKRCRFIYHSVYLETEGGNV